MSIFRLYEGDYPETFSFLGTYKSRLEGRDIKPVPETENEWYRDLDVIKVLIKCDVPVKIVVGVLSQGR